MSTDEFRTGACPWSDYPDCTLQLVTHRPHRMGIIEGHGRCSLQSPKFVTCSLLQDLNFEVFNIIVLIMAIIVVGNFLRDLKSNYLEGSLCILVYLIIAVRRICIASTAFIELTWRKVASYYYPNPNLKAGDTASEGVSTGSPTGAEGSSTGEAAAETTKAALRYMMG